MTRHNIWNVRRLFNARNAGRRAAYAALGWLVMGGALWAQQKSPMVPPPRAHLAFHEHSRPATMKYAPKLPSVRGCYTLTKGKWVKEACLREQYVRTHYPRFHKHGGTSNNEEYEPAIQFGPSAANPRTTPMPITGGAIDIGFMTLGSVTDTLYGLDSFSIQLNTNFFTTTINNAIHTVDVQFTDQHTRPADYPNQSTEDHVCVVSVDYTVNPEGFTETCQNLNGNRPVRSGDFAAIQAYQDFNGTEYNLKMVFQLSWDSQEGIYGIVAPDTYGLTRADYGNWTQLSGSILGYGDTSMAKFTATTLWVALDAWNCQFDQPGPIDSPMDCVAFDPGPWTWAATTPSVTVSDVTDEQNNLTPTYTASTPASGLPTLQCPGWNGCYIEYTETTTPPPPPPSPQCQAGEVWDPALNRCVPPGCPASCTFGCYPGKITPPGPPSEPVVWTCKPPPGI